MLDITARLSGRSVFLAGEAIECHVTFTNIVNPQSKNGGANTANSGRVKSAKLAWASAQIHCQCSVSDSRVVMNETRSVTDLSTAASETSFVPFKGEKGSIVLSTKPTILFCDLSLLPSESQTYIYRESLPADAPPSYRGAALKYSYKITIGAQRFGCATKLLRVPFRVLVVPGLEDMSVYQEPEEFKPNNPFHQQHKDENSLLDVAMENLQIITCRKGPSFYNITNARGKVARFCLFKQAFRIGDDVIGTCDFTLGTIPCVQFSVTLQSEEVISESCLRKSSNAMTLTSYSKHHEFCLNTAKTHISIAIPLTATPSFITDLVCLKWRLHFEFVTSKTPLPVMAAAKHADESALWQGPSQLDVETMTWDLPIKVFATNPLFVTSVSLLKTQNSCAL